MDLMKGIEESRERKEKKKERKVEQRESNKHLAKMIAKELKFSTPTSDDSRIATIEKRLTELENLVRTFLSWDEAEDLQESSTPVHDAADTTQTDQEEEYPGLRLKKQKYKGKTLPLNIEAIRHKSRNSVWYKVTGEECVSGETVYFTPFVPNVYRFPGSVGIREGKNHEKIVQLLCDAGIITGEETGRYTTLFSFDGLGEDYICYRLTDQAIEYTNQNQKEKYPGLKLKTMNGAEGKLTSTLKLSNPTQMKILGMTSPATIPAGERRCSSRNTPLISIGTVTVLRLICGKTTIKSCAFSIMLVSSPRRKHIRALDLRRNAYAIA